MESKASFNNPAAGRPWGSGRNKWKRGHPLPGSFPPSFPSPLSDLLFSLPLETGLLHTCVFSRRAPNRFIYFHVLASGRGHADFLIVLFKRKTQGRDSLARPSQVLCPGPISDQWVCLWKARGPLRERVPRASPGNGPPHGGRREHADGLHLRELDPCAGRSLMDSHSR